MRTIFGMEEHAPETRRLYTDLAWLWPLWGDAADEYAHYCEHIRGLIRKHAMRPVASLLVIGCGGGKNIFNLRRDYEVTGLDLSPAMIDQAKALNPDCEILLGDMRDFQLGRTFDAVLMDDAISHMNCRADFIKAFRVAFDHLKPGGVMIVTPDVTVETFRQNKTTATQVNRDGLGVVFVENVFDPNPADDQYETTILYLIREHGCLRIETDHWRLGIFSLDTWRRVLSEIGFEVHEGEYDSGEDRYKVFSCVKTV